MLPLEDTIQHFELLLGEKVSSHLFPKKISSRERMAIWYWRFLNTFQRGERRRRVSRYHNDETYRGVSHFIPCIDVGTITLTL